MTTDSDPTPSGEDRRLTHKLETILDLIYVVLFDHMIFGEGEPYSLRVNGDLLNFLFRVINYLYLFHPATKAAAIRNSIKSLKA